MNKIISINLKGIIFQVEEEAYDRLKKYLETLNRHFASDESRLEILDDIERRLAEMMQERLKTKAAITVADVEEIIAIMGNPGDFETGTEGETTTENQAKSTETQADTNAPKRFFRDTEGRILGGVCSGAGHYFGVDPLWIRLGFLFMFFVLGTGLLFYLILWVIIPEAKTPSERLQMKGEKVNIETIEKAVKDEFERLKKNFDDYRTGKRKNNPLERVAGILVEIARAFGTVVVKAVGVLLLIWATILFITFVAFGIQLAINGSSPFNSLAFESSELYWTALIATGVLILTIITSFIRIGTGLLRTNKPKRNKYFLWPVRTLAAAAIVVLIVIAVFYGRAFSNHKTEKETVSLGSNDTLIVSAFNPVYYRLYGSYNAQNQYDYHSKEWHFLKPRFQYTQTASTAILNDSLWNIVGLEVLPSTKPDWELEIERTAYGEDDFKARAYAEKIPVDYALANGKLTLNTHFYLGQNIPWRKQKIKYILWMPVGKTARFDQGLVEIMNHSLKNRVTDPNNYGMTWQMGENGLKCLDCKKIDRTNLPVGEKRFDIVDFKNVEIDLPATVIVTEGSKYEVTMSAPLDVRENVNVHLSGTTLIMDYDRDLFDIFDGIETNDIKIYITLPRLEKLEAHGAASVELVSARGEKLEVELSGASHLKGNIDVQELDMEVSGSSRAELLGKATTMKAGASGASGLKLLGLQTEKAHLKITGASNAHVDASHEISGEASGASHITYTQHPNIELDVKTTGASDIDPEK